MGTELQGPDEELHVRPNIGESGERVSDEPEDYLLRAAMRLVKALPTSTVIMVLATAVIAFATVAYTVYAKRQWIIIGNQLYAGGEANKISQMTQRAYVDIPQQIEIRTTVQNGRVISWTPEVTIVNDGNTGTYNAREVVNIYTSNKEMSEDFDYPVTGNWQHSDLGPHQIELFEAPPIGIAAVRSMQRGGHVYVYGLAEYWDVFQFYSPAENKAKYLKHRREFCYELRLDSPTGDITSPKYGLPKSMQLHGPHNCTDGDCPDHQEKVMPETTK